MPQHPVRPSGAVHSSGFMMPVRRTTYRQMQSPLQVLQRRYAAGEITREEYEERRTTLLRDANMK
jgi:putative membrane protein